VDRLSLARKSTGQRRTEICRGPLVLTMVDQSAREALATEARGSFSAYDVIDALNRLSMSRRRRTVTQVAHASNMAGQSSFLASWMHGPIEWM
jgi:hypothetical protein